MPTYKHMTENAKAIFLALSLHDIRERMGKRCVELCADLDKNSPKAGWGLGAVCIENAEEDMAYFLEEMQFVEEVAERFGLEVEKDIRGFVAREYKERGLRGLCALFVPRFIFCERRYMTEDEWASLMERQAALAEEIMAEILAEEKATAGDPHA